MITPSVLIFSLFLFFLIIYVKKKNKKKNEESRYPLQQMTAQKQPKTIRQTPLQKSITFSEFGFSDNSSIATQAIARSKTSWSRRVFELMPVSETVNSF